MHIPLSDETFRQNHLYTLPIINFVIESFLIELAVFFPR